MYQLETIRQCLDEKQFTQVAYDHESGKYVVSILFRFTNVFKSISYEKSLDAIGFYNRMIK